MIANPIFDAATILRMRHRKTRAALQFCLLASCAPAAAMAQSAEPTATSATANNAGDIIVTARRRNESISRTPLSIVAMTSEDLEKRQVSSEIDIQHTAPGVTLRQGLSQNQINYSIRGQTIDSYSSSPPGVLPYINDVQISNSSANAFYDLESIQVLKGPQGTLFGRNTTGGAVLFATKKPTFDFGGELTGRVGSFNDRELLGAINAPLVKDKIAIRIAGDYHERDGYIQNIYTGPLPVGRRDLGAIDNQSIRASLLIKPTDDIENITVYQYSFTGGTNAGGEIFSVNACGTPGVVTVTDCLYNPTNPAFNAYIAANPGTFPGGLSAYLARQQARGPYKVEYDSPSFFRQRAQFITNTTTMHVNDDITLKNIFGWGRSNTNYATDIDGTPYNIDAYGNFNNVTGQPLTVRQISNEFQLQGNAFDKRLTYILGLYYSKQKNGVNYRQCVFGILGNICNSLASLQDDTSKALFAQASYHFSRKLTLTGGVRYTWEKVVSNQKEPQFAQPGDAPSNYDLYPDFRRLEGKYHKPSWTVSLEYQATQQLLLYATQRGSWRTGGFNGFAPPLPGLTGNGGSEFLPETTTDVEIGAKFNGRLADRAFRINVAAYTQWVKDVQRTVYVVLPSGGLAAVTASVPKAKVSGIELDGQFNATDWFRFGGAVSYAHPRFTSNVASYLSDGVLSTTQFGPYPDTPKWSGSIFGEFTLPIPQDMGDLTLRGDYYGQSSSYYSSTEATLTPGTKLPGYKLVNFRLDWSSIGGTPISAALFVNNAFKQVYYSGGLQTGNALGLNTAIPGVPRTIGGELRLKF